MSKNVIIFGARKFGVSNTPLTTTKYPESAVITVEPSKDGGRSRRVLFNAKASEVLNLEMGEVQQIVFGFVEGTTIGLIANASLLGSEVVAAMTTYRTSKNKVSFETTKEKGKAISSTTIANEISTYFSLDDSFENEFSLTPHEAEGVESFSLEIMTSQEAPVQGTVEAMDQAVTFEEVQDEIAPVDTVEYNDSDFNLSRTTVTSTVAESDTQW